MSNGYELFINPHKLVQHHGMYRMEYIGLTELRRRLDRIMQETNVSSYTIKRLDICIDTT